MKHRFHKLALLNLIFVVFFGGITASAQDQWSDVHRIVAVGDIHGDYGGYIAVLKNAGLINRRENWDAGETHFVQLGDLPDRGPDTDKIIAHMQDLERQAERAGGKVHALIGNHEAMNIYGDLRYVHPGEYEAFRSRNSRRLRDNYYEQSLANIQATEPEFVMPDDFRERFDTLYPLGYVEHRMAWHKDGEIGKWVRQHNTVVKVNRNLFVHGGIGPETLGLSLEEINARVRAELGGDLPEEPGLSESPNGPLWYRGLASGEEALEQAHVDALLAFYEVDRIVIGHTPGMETVVPRFDGKVLIIDTGISAYYGAHLGSLLIEDDEVTAIQRGVAVAVPDSDDALLEYYESVLKAESDSAVIRNKIQSLLTAPATSDR